MDEGDPGVVDTSRPCRRSSLPQNTTPGDDMMSAWRRLKEFTWWHESLLLILLIALLIIAENLQPGFVSWKAQLFLSRHLWELALLTLGMTLIILTGGIDLSIG